MKKTDATLDKKTLLRLEHEIKQLTAEMSKGELEEFRDDLLDRVLSDPGNPILREKASMAANVWKRRYDVKAGK